MASRAPDASNQGRTIDERGDDRSYMLLVVSFLCAAMAGASLIA